MSNEITLSCDAISLQLVRSALKHAVGSLTLRRQEDGSNNEEEIGRTCSGREGSVVMQRERFFQGKGSLFAIRITLCGNIAIRAFSRP